MNRMSEMVTPEGDRRTAGHRGSPEKVAEEVAEVQVVVVSEEERWMVSVRVELKLMLWRSSVRSSSGSGGSGGGGGGGGGQWW